MAKSTTIVTPKTTSTSSARRFTRSADNKKIAGVCAGIARYFGWDTTLVRIVTVAGVFVSLGFVLVAYILMWIFVPQE
jgi:phage shock protein C